MMPRDFFRPVVAITALGVPVLSLIAPSWFAVTGVGPSWGVLWLLPWALVNGPFAGLIAGLLLGLILDAISLGQVSQVFALMLLGFWWGRLGRTGPPIEKSLNLGLLAWFGSVLVSSSILAQFLMVNFSVRTSLFYSWGLHTLFAKSIVTGLLSPLICSVLLSLFMRYKLIGKE